MGSRFTEHGGARGVRCDVPEFNATVMLDGHHRWLIIVLHVPVAADFVGGFFFALFPPLSGPHFCDVLPAIVPAFSQMGLMTRMLCSVAA